MEKVYSRHATSLFKVLQRLSYYKEKAKSTKYYPPKKLGVKWQLDIKYVPNACYAGEIPDKFCQYTVIDEASNEKFIYPYEE